jgi:hypothetical protein
VFVKKILLAAVAVALSGATVASAAPPGDGPHAGPCHVYWNPSPVDVPGGKGTPFVYCDY